MARNIHLIGICGVAMGTLAQMLHDRGCAVSGSDQNIYPPMSDILKKSGMKLYSGFSADNVTGAELVIIGNAVSRGNPEAERVLNDRIPYLSMAQALYNFFLHDREVIAVAGTHGKSTTTALLAHLLVSAGEDPSFFVGGVTRNYDSNYRLGRGKYFVIEGDEYDSAFFEKVPKFVYYRPCHLVLTSLEFDHADIYRDLGEIETWFRRLVNMIPSNGNIVYSSSYKNLGEIVAKSLSKRYSCGKDGADFTYAFRGYDGDFSGLDIVTPLGNFSPRTQLFGEFNFDNVIAAAAMARLLGIGGEAVARGLESFQGVRRRQELIYDRNNIKIYDDFAHHPTAIRYVLRTMRERYPGARLWALYEPRSATSRRNVFQDVLPASFAPADAVLIKTPYEGSAIREGDRLDPDRLLRDIRAINENAGLFGAAEDMLDHVARNIDAREENVVVLMSNGGFDGIYGKIPAMMEAVAGS
ncbi:MAG TPA: Mur ligase domain-containing protein [Spirochaetota bacterium]|nr:Mur ligase domain-containing protein [Spirochaetota bacterium]HQF07862.1 Mur ligase domain-containing protein [Spirochaetota bacterium]HQH96915.1 Mur ligase domain-containing protein [Spirochaetota bacterium]